MRIIATLPLALVLACSADVESQAPAPSAPTPDPDVSVSIEVGQDGGAVHAKGENGSTDVVVDPDHAKVRVDKKKSGG